MESKVTLGELQPGDRFTHGDDVFVWTKIYNHERAGGWCVVKSDIGQVTGLYPNHLVTRFDNAVGRKDDQQKPRPDLFSPDFELEIAKVLAAGADEYGAENWKLVDRWRYVAAACRHWNAYRRGELTDPKSGFSHLAHLACNLSFLFEKDKNAASTKPVST